MTEKGFIISAVAVVAVLIIIIFTLGVRINLLDRRLEDNKLSYNRELESNKEMIDEISQNLLVLSSGSNEVRRSLNLPEKQLIQKNSERGGTVPADLSVSFFDAFRFLVDNEELDTAAGEFTTFITDNGISEYFSDKGYIFERNNLLNASVLQDQRVYLSFSYDAERGQIDLRDIEGNAINIAYDDEDIFEIFENEVVIFRSYDDKLLEIGNSIQNIVGSEEVGDLLNDRGFSIIEIDAGRFSITNDKDDSQVGLFRQDDRDILLNSDRFTYSEDFEKALIEFLGATSDRTETERIDDLVLAKMKEIFSDEGFKVLLETNDCKRELNYREDIEFIYFDIYKTDGTVQGTFVLQKDFGEVLLLSGDGKYLKSLKMFTPGNDIRSLITDAEEDETVSPYIFDDSSENFLVVGTHEHNADTMIIVNANNKTGRLNMISVPRDLYYKGNKINNIYKVHGPERLAAELSDITGLDIKKYISIDMFAFIDVVNILGGLDVTIEEDLIDPTYKVKNNGVWSTLYYRKGTHHLDGVAALRVARSRHGSDDFDRSKRQQQVIEAVFDKMRTINAGDLGKVYEFVSTVFSYIETNLNTADIVRNFLMYKDNQIADPNIINTDNILYDTYTNLYLLPADEQKTLRKDENFYKGLWIVLPRNNDWNLIKKHIEKILNNG